MELHRGKEPLIEPLIEPSINCACAARKDFPTVLAHDHNPLKDLTLEFATVVGATDLSIMAHPVLLPEDKHISDFKRALMVWRADTRNARALASALSTQALADKVRLLSVTDEDDLSPDDEVALQCLNSHSINAEELTLQSDTRLTPKLIDAICDERDVSLLAIGGGLPRDLTDAFVTGIGRSAAPKPSRSIIAIA